MAGGHINLFEDVERVGCLFLHALLSEGSLSRTTQQTISMHGRSTKKAAPETEKGIPLAPSEKDLKPWYSDRGNGKGKDRDEARECVRYTPRPRLCTKSSPEHANSSASLSTTLSHPSTTNYPLVLPARLPQVRRPPALGLQTSVDRHRHHHYPSPAVQRLPDKIANPPKDNELSNLSDGRSARWQEARPQVPCTATWRKAIETYSTDGRSRRRGGTGNAGGMSMIGESGEVPVTTVRDGEFLGPATGLGCTVL